jgi:hypothetical protein
LAHRFEAGDPAAKFLDGHWATALLETHAANLR